MTSGKIEEIFKVFKLSLTNLKTDELARLTSRLSLGQGRSMSLGFLGPANTKAHKTDDHPAKSPSFVHISTMISIYCNIYPAGVS